MEMNTGLISIIVMASKNDNYTIVQPITDVRQREWEIKQEWTKRATEKNDRIIAEGYAERQIADSLRIAGKVNTEL